MSVSVALATYNSMKYITEQLDSIRMQSIPVDEVVIIDDCSSDDTVFFLQEYIKAFNLTNWKIFKHERNEGFIQTFTDALTLVSGDVVILCDHDDIWLEDKVKTLKSVFDKCKECLALATSFIQIDEDGNEVHVNLKRNHANNNLIRRAVHSGQLNKMSLEDVAVYNISPGCACAVRQSLVKEFVATCKVSDTKEILPHDWKLNIIAAAKDGLYYLDVPTTKYRIYSSNTIGLGHQSNFEKRKAVVKKNCNEKSEAAQIVSCLKGEESSEFVYYNDLEKIFLKRKEFLESGNYFSAFRVMMSSLKYSGLYESLVMDIITRLKR